MSNPNKQNPPRRIDVRVREDDYYDRTVEVVTHLNEQQTATAAFTRYEALNLISKLAAYLAATEGAK